MKLWKNISSILIIALATVTFAGCGGEDGGGGNGGGTCNTTCPPSVTDQEDLVGNLFGFIWVWTFVSCAPGAAPTLVTDRLQALTDLCDDGGSVEVTESGIDFDNCEEGGQTIDGSIAIDVSGDTWSFDWDNLTMDDGIDVLSIDGKISCDTSTGDAEFDGMTFGLNGDAVCATGDLTIDPDLLTLDGEVDISCGGDTVAQCLFNDVYGGDATGIEESCDF